ncbi:MAG TPA: peptidoglycan-binding protein [Actinophytocola sp.]|uniref:peptidoglycan-binding protein n=1 Tax=Actinophytocola sp. TaxID=1872138 RepID=UPI002DB9CD5D|nr:peptidoglycan-binding protein [Actinophytocola sp.]HEU5471049.1 peptidoglycan-binding protein [Actinophytocola sp.]
MEWPQSTQSRRWLLSRGLTAGAALALPVTLGAKAASAATAQATVDMEQVLVACQVDPPKPNTDTTPGTPAHVTAVEQALRAEGLLVPGQVDGHYGTATLSAYAAWQRSLGFTGIDANGVPGRTSLTELGAGRFTVANIVTAGSRTDSYGGRRVNTRTATMLRAADQMFSWSLVLTQGSYTSDNPDSAGTHDGGGVVDISVSALTTTQRWQTVRALRTVGFAAWLRTPSDGFAYHIHANAISDPDMSRPARNQVHDYYFGRNGLANHAADNTPQAYRVPFTWWERHQRG